jgi:uncharacterized phiE125 gp8 family phage protein
MYTLVSGPSGDLLQIEAIRGQCNFLPGEIDFDDRLMLCGKAAAGGVEDYLGCALLTQTWEGTFPALDRDLRLRIEKGPNIAVTGVSVMVAGTYQVLAPSDYAARKISAHLSIVRAAQGVSWPAADQDEDAYRVTFSCGFSGTASGVPVAIVQAALMMAADLFTNSEASRSVNVQDNPAVLRLLNQFRAPSL